MIYITFNGVENEIPYEKESLTVQLTIDSTFDSGYFTSAPLSENIGDLDISKKIPRDLKVRVVYNGKEYLLKTGETTVDKLTYSGTPLYVHKVNLISRTEGLSKLPLENIAVTQPKGDYGTYSRSSNVISSEDKTSLEDYETSIYQFPSKYKDIQVYVDSVGGTIPYENILNSNTSKIDGLTLISLEEYKINVSFTAYNISTITDYDYTINIYYGSTLIKTRTINIPEATESTYVYSEKAIRTPGSVTDAISFNYTPTVSDSISVEISGNINIAIESIALLITAIEVEDKPIRTNAQVLDKMLRNTDYVLDTETRAKLNNTATENTYNEYTVYDSTQKIASEEGALVKVGSTITGRIWNVTTYQTPDLIADDINEYSPYDYELGTILEIGNKHYENVETINEKQKISFKYYDNPTIIDPVGERDRTQLAELSDYVSALELNTRNVIKPLRYSPFKNGWKSLRADGIGQLTTDNIVYETEDNIDRIIQVKVRGFASQSINHTWTVEDETDITERVLDFKYYDTLDAESDYTLNGKSLYLKNNTLYYNQGDNKIDGMYYTGEHKATLIGTESVVRSLYECILAQRSNDVGELVTRNGTQSQDDPATTEDLDGDLAIEMQVIYSNSTTSRARVYKDDQTGFEQERISYINESASINESQAIGDYAQQLVNRMGGTKTVVSGVCDIEDVPEVGDRDSAGRVYTVIKLELGERVNYTYTLTQDYNVITSYIGTKSAHRVEEVPSSNVVDRTLRYTSKLIFTDTLELYTTKIENPKVILDSLFSETGGLHYGYLECGLSNGETKKLHMSLDSDSKGRTVEIKWKMKDNYSAGLKRYSVVIEEEDIWLISNVQYTDYYGKVNDIRFKLYFDTLGGIDTDLYPQATGTVGDDLFIDISDDIDKDAREQIGGLVEIPLLSESDSVRVYNGLAKYNKLVQGSDRIRVAVLQYLPLRNANKIDLSRAYDVTDTLIDNSAESQLQFTITYDLLNQNGLGVAFYNIDTLELCLVIEEEITFGSNNILRYWKIDDAQIGNEGDLPIQLEIAADFKDSDSFEIEMYMQENTTIDADFNDSDSFVVELIKRQSGQIPIAFMESDSFNISMTKTENTSEPTVSFTSWSYDGVKFYTFNFSVKNEDSVSAEIFADGNTTPTTSRGTVASQSSVNVAIITESTSATLYARAKASGKNYSTVDSATGTIT